MKVNDIKHSISDIRDGLQSGRDAVNVVSNAVVGGLFTGAGGVAAGAVTGVGAALVHSFANPAAVNEPIMHAVGLGTVAAFAVYGAAKHFMQGIEANRHERALDAAREAVKEPGFDPAVLNTPIKNMVVLVTPQPSDRASENGAIYELGRSTTPSKAWMEEMQWRQATVSDLLSDKSPPGAVSMLADLAKTGTVDPKYVADPNSPNPLIAANKAQIEQTANRLSGFLKSFTRTEESSLKSTMRPGH